MPDTVDSDTTEAVQPMRAGVERSHVVLDGTELFEIRNLPNFPAAERAETINRKLSDLVNSDDQIEIESVGDRIDHRVIQNSAAEDSDENLLTVTEFDLFTQSSVEEQADEWVNRLQINLAQAQSEREPDYRRRATIYSLIVLCVAIAIQIGIHFFGKFFWRYVAQFASTYPAAKVIWQLACLGLEAGISIAVLYYITDVFPEFRAGRYELGQVLSAPIITLGNGRYSAIQLLLLVVCSVGLWFVVGGITQLLKIYVLSQTGLNLENRIQDIVSILTQYILTFLGLIILLQIWGLDVSSLAILASVLGIGISFGIQNITNNFISGVIINLERPIEPGDFVNVGELVGMVKQIGARSTEIRTLDQVTIIVPNSRFLETEVINWSHGDPVCRLNIPVGVAYGSDVEQVKTALLAAARRHPDVLLRPKPEVWFDGFGASSLDFKLFVWIGEPKKQFKVKSDLYYEIEASLRKYHIEIPFPQRDLHVRSPQLEKLVNALQQQFIQQRQNGTASLPPQPKPIASITNGSDIPKSEPETVAPSPHLEALVKVMQGADGLDVRDRHYLGNIYPACFTGTSLVEWLIQYHNSTHADALQIGQQLLDQQLICHVHEEPTFRDGFSFYRFFNASLSPDTVIQ